MATIKAVELLRGMEAFRNSIFTLKSITQAEDAYLRLVGERICDDLHAASNAEVEKLVDTILSMPDNEQVRRFLEEQNPNLLAFLFARISHVVRTLEAHADELIPMSKPAALVRWALVDYWNISRPPEE